jgi:hypothetical protein
VGPEEVWELVELGGGVAEMTVRDLRDTFGYARLTRPARATIIAELEALGLHLEPPLEGLALTERIRVIDAFERESAPSPDPEPPTAMDDEPESTLAAAAEAAATEMATVQPSTALVRVVPARPPAVVPRPRTRRVPRPGRAALGALIATVLVAAAAGWAFVRSGDERPAVPAAAGVEAGATLGAAAAPVADAVRLQLYGVATRLGNEGRYLEAREAMLALGPFRKAPAAARSYSVRAAQGMLAEARTAWAAGRIDSARTLVREAGRIAPELSSLPAARALVAGPA